MTMPTSDQCSAHAPCKPEGPHQYTYADWHPQWGGYVGKCLVSFSVNSEGGDEPGCFDVEVWHDGEFPHDDDSRTVTRHYCAATQLIEFGLTVLEQQVVHQTGIRASEKELKELRRRIDALLDKAVT